MARNTSLVGERAPLDVNGVNTIAEATDELDAEQMSRPVGTRRLPIDWAESEWFRVWLKLARHEEDATQEMAC